MGNYFRYFHIFSFLDRLKKKGKNLNSKIFTFGLFLLLSTTLWLFNSLRKSYTSEINCQVALINPPSGQALCNDSVHNLAITIKTDGFTLARFAFSPEFPLLSVNLTSNKYLIRKGDRGDFVLTSYFARKISEYLPKNVQIISVSPDTLMICLSKKTSKRVPIVLNHQIAFAKQFGLSDQVKLSPDSITVFGPYQDVEKVIQVNTEKFVLSDVKATINRSLPLKNINNITFSHSDCMVTIPVDHFTESRTAVPITAKNLPEGMSIKFFPASVMVSYNTAISKIGTITENDFCAEVDFSSFSQLAPPEKMRVKLVKTPKVIESVNYSPLMVDYILEGKH